MIDSTKPLLLWVDEKWRRGYTHVPLLFPFWGTVVNEKAPYTKRVFERYNLDTSCYKLARSIQEADVVFLPYRYNQLRGKDEALMREVADAARRAQKPLLVDGTGDIEFPAPLPHAIVLRISGYRFLKHPNDIHIPLYADDLLESACGGTLALRKKTPKPRIGFSGWTHIPPFIALKAVVKELPYRLRGIVDSRYRACRKGVFFRQQALNVLRHSQLIDSHFIERPTFSAHTATASDDPEVLRRQFIENLLESDYGLDVRGDANSSVRLYEILSLGRIPIIVDTERSFPFEDELDYSSFSLVVDFRDMAHLPKRIADFHASLSPEKFEAMQRAARDVYRNYFRLDVLMPHLVKRIRERITRMP